MLLVSLSQNAPSIMAVRTLPVDINVAFLEIREPGGNMKGGEGQRVDAKLPTRILSNSHAFFQWPGQIL